VALATGPTDEEEHSVKNGCASCSAANEIAGSEHMNSKNAPKSSETTILRVYYVNLCQDHYDCRKIENKISDTLMEF